MTPLEISQQVAEGLLDPIEAQYRLKELRLQVETAENFVKGQALRQFRDQYGEVSETSHRGLLIKYSGGGRTYDYKAIPAWVSKKKELNLIQELSKRSLQNLQHFPPRPLEVHPDTKEEIGACIAKHTSAFITIEKVEQPT